MPAQKIETGHSNTIHDVTMDNYATASSDSTNKMTGVSNSDTSQHLATLTGHRGPVWQAAWGHPKFGSILILAFWLMYSVTTNHLSVLLLGHQMNLVFAWLVGLLMWLLVGSGMLDPVQKLASGGCDNTVKEWKLSNGTWKMDCFPALQMHKICEF
ncbi:hypothetical protein POM88_031629 [Heracleum sosnowskyi]|uniref:Uncharacterized protein n=1 Tax=Heracleum sosnowskyi TaxID=360622 RepID=A0AAD8MJB1_9APIA|nr:hypothetical protein POM88_031629 [Heracleum sosnowskyi]